MYIMTHLHLSYLQQVSDLLEDQHKPLAAKLGYIAKKIASKHVVHTSGTDSLKLRHCQSCQAPITCTDTKCDKGKLILKCSLCGNTRRYRVIPKCSNKANKPMVQSNDEIARVKQSNALDK